MKRLFLLLTLLLPGCRLDFVSRIPEGDGTLRVLVKEGAGSKVSIRLGGVLFSEYRDAICDEDGVAEFTGLGNRIYGVEVEPATPLTWVRPRSRRVVPGETAEFTLAPATRIRMRIEGSGTLAWMPASNTAPLLDLLKGVGTTETYTYVRDKPVDWYLPSGQGGTIVLVGEWTTTLGWLASLGAPAEMIAPAISDMDPLWEPVYFRRVEDRPAREVVDLGTWTLPSPTENRWRGRVTADQGRPFWLAVHPKGGEGMGALIQLGKNGGFDVKGLPAGTYDIIATIWDEKWITREVSLDLKAGDSRRNLRLQD